MQIPFYIDTSGSMPDVEIQRFLDELRPAMRESRRRYEAFLKWQRRHKPERARNRIRRASRRANRR